ncbi:MAG: hypothetical protein ACRC41_05925, partial [Sarcina sp.]
STELREREDVELVTCSNGINMHTDGEGEEERGERCIMGSLLAVEAYSSITKGWFRIHPSQP